VIHVDPRKIINKLTTKGGSSLWNRLDGFPETKREQTVWNVMMIAYESKYVVG
jgi:hypothetical protein